MFRFRDKSLVNVKDKFSEVCINQRVSRNSEFLAISLKLKASGCRCWIYMSRGLFDTIDIEVLRRLEKSVTYNASSLTGFKFI